MILVQTAVEGALPAEGPTVKLDLVGPFSECGVADQDHDRSPSRVFVARLDHRVLKMMQLARLRAVEGNFERRARHVGSPRELFEVAGSHSGSWAQRPRRPTGPRRYRSIVPYANGLR